MIYIPKSYLYLNFLSTGATPKTITLTYHYQFIFDRFPSQLTSHFHYAPFIL